MSNIIYHKGSLFDAPKGSILAHACNTKGVWGAGIAKAFKQRNPNISKSYSKFCQKNNHDEIIGTTYMVRHAMDLDIVACLFTSKLGSFGKFDDEDSILKNTHNALHSLGDILRLNGMKYEVHIPQINAGIFKVPWSKTETILKLHDYLTFHVWIYNNKESNTYIKPLN